MRCGLAGFAKTHVQYTISMLAIAQGCWPRDAEIGSLKPHIYIWPNGLNEETLPLRRLCPHTSPTIGAQSRLRSRTDESLRKIGKVVVGCRAASGFHTAAHRMTAYPAVGGRIQL